MSIVNRCCNGTKTDNGYCCCCHCQ
ncbi:hypothetical protein YPPY53_2074, partial [Yersinia pestis PY-53]